MFFFIDWFLMFFFLLVFDVFCVGFCLFWQIYCSEIEIEIV